MFGLNGLILNVSGVDNLFGLLPPNFEYRNSLVVFVLGLVFAFAVRIFMRYALPKLTSFTNSDLDDKLAVACSRPLAYASFAIALYLTIKALPPRFDAELWVAATLKISKLFIIGCFFWTALAINRTFFDHIGDKAAEKAKEGKQDKFTFVKEFYPLLRKVTAVFIFMVMVIAVMKTFNQDIYSIVTALGVGSLAVGLAAQDTLGNMFAGFALLIDRNVRPGDRIRLSDGTVADVADIGIRSTRLLNFDKNIIIIPNKQLVNERVINYAYPNDMMRGRIEIGVAYGCDVEKVIKILEEEAAKYEDVTAAPAPLAFIDRFADFSVNIILDFYTKPYTNVFNVSSRLKIDVYKRFSAEGINIPFPTRTLRSDEPIKVEVIKQS